LVSSRVREEPRRRDGGSGGWIRLLPHSAAGRKQAYLQRRHRRADLGTGGGSRPARGDVSRRRGRFPGRLPPWRRARSRVDRRGAARRARMTAGVVLRLRKDEDRRIRAGHLWVYSNEIDVGATPIANLEPGSPVDVQDARGGFLGRGYANPRSLIAVRLLTRDP